MVPVWENDPETRATKGICKYFWGLINPGVLEPIRVLCPQFSETVIED